MLMKVIPMSDITTAFWGMVINNYDETELALVQQGYPDHIRQLVYTPEVGESGTPHIQAFIRLYRQHRMSYVKKLFPRGSFRALTSDEYKLNAQRYAQKQDKTSNGASVINNNPFPDPVVELTEVLRAVWDRCGNTRWAHFTEPEVMKLARLIEAERVADKPNLAKFYVSATYKAVKKDFWRSIGTFIEREADAEKSDTHTHTHTQPRVIFSTGNITDDAQEDSCDGAGGEEGEEDEDDDYGDDSEAEAYSTSGDSGCSEEDDE